MALSAIMLLNQSFPGNPTAEVNYNNPNVIDILIFQSRNGHSWA